MHSLPLLAPPLGVLSIHLDGARCRVGCEFCYLGDRVAASSSPAGGADDGAPPEPGAPDLALLEQLLARLDYAEVAVAVSEPAHQALAPLSRIARAARQRGRPLSITTTAQVIAAEPSLVDLAQRVNLSVDPRKGLIDPRRIALVARTIKARAVAPGSAPEVVLIASLVNPCFAERLIAGLLAELCALEAVDAVALNALKPPPPWCDRAFWLATCARLAPLLARQLDRKLFLDCYVAARILGLGACPARPDVSPGREFRACVYQPAPDFHFADADDLAARLRGFVAPAVCPFPIP